MMKKIIVLFNGIKAPWHITTFAINIAKQNDGEVLALFLKDETAGYFYPGDITFVQKEFSPKDEKADNEKLEEKIYNYFKLFATMRK